MLFTKAILVLLVPTTDAFMSLSPLASSVKSSGQRNLMMRESHQHEDEVLSTEGSFSRRSLMKRIPLVAAAAAGVVASTTTAFPMSANAIAEGRTVTGAKDGNLPDLPIEAGKSYLQYRFQLQLAADYYIFDLQGKLGNIDDWGEVNQLFQTNNNRGQGQPNKIERDYTNTMRILSLSFPPDEAEEMRAAQFKFERAMFKITKATSGVRRDLPVEIDPSLVAKAEQGWEDGRVALNEFFTSLNQATGLNEMRLIPAAGPDQRKEYRRSARRYFDLAKKTKLCQNRGGPALSQAWGQLMVSGYLQDNFDSCGIPDPVEYFYQ